MSSPDFSRKFLNSGHKSNELFNHDKKPLIWIMINYMDSVLHFPWWQRKCAIIACQKIHWNFCRTLIPDKQTEFDKCLGRKFCEEHGICSKGYFFFTTTQSIFHSQERRVRGTIWFNIQENKIILYFSNNLKILIYVKGRTVFLRV